MRRARGSSVRGVLKRGVRLGFLPHNRTRHVLRSGLHGARDTTERREQRARRCGFAYAFGEVLRRIELLRCVVRRQHAARLVQALGDTFTREALERAREPPTLADRRAGKRAFKRRRPRQHVERRRGRARSKAGRGRLGARHTLHRLAFRRAGCNQLLHGGVLQLHRTRQRHDLIVCLPCGIQTLHARTGTNRGACADTAGRSRAGARELCRAYGRTTSAAHHDKLRRLLGHEVDGKGRRAKRLGKIGEELAGLVLLPFDRELSQALLCLHDLGLVFLRPLAEVFAAAAQEVVHVARRQANACADQRGNAGRATRHRKARIGRHFPNGSAALDHGFLVAHRLLLRATVRTHERIRRLLKPTTRRALRHACAAHHLRRADHLRHIVGVFGIAARLQRARVSARVTAGTDGAAVTALDQACVVAAEVVKRCVLAIGIAASGHIVGRPCAAPGEVLDVAQVVRARNDRLAPPGFDAPLADENARINVQALAHRLCQRRNALHEAAHIRRHAASGGGCGRLRLFGLGRSVEFFNEAVEFAHIFRSAYAYSGRLSVL